MDGVHGTCLLRWVFGDSIGSEVSMHVDHQLL